MAIPNEEIKNLILQNKKEIEQKIGRELSQRPFKFRAYSLREKAWCHAFCISKQGDFAELWKRDLSLPEYEEQKDMIEFIIQQATGVFDMDGKEIYEGDILKGRYGDIGEVVFSEKKYGFRLRKINDWNYGDLTGFKHSGYRIIGNIFFGINQEVK